MDLRIESLLQTAVSFPGDGLGGSDEKALGNFTALTQHSPSSKHTYASRTWRIRFLQRDEPWITSS